MERKQYEICIYWGSAGHPTFEHVAAPTRAGFSLSRALFRKNVGGPPYTNSLPPD